MESGSGLGTRLPSSLITALKAVFQRRQVTRKLWLSILACLVMGVGSALSVVPIYPDIFGIAMEALGPIIGGGLVFKVGFPYTAAILGLVLLVCAILLIIATVIQKVYRSMTYHKFDKSEKL